MSRSIVHVRPKKPLEEVWTNEGYIYDSCKGTKMKTDI